LTNGGYVDPAFGFARGFERYVTTAEPSGTQVNLALDLFDSLGGESLFLFFHTYQVHDYAPDESAARALFGDLEPLGEGWTRNLDWVFHKTGKLSLDRQAKWLINRYDAALRSVDEAFGRLVDGLAQRHLLDETTFLVTSDHGEELFERGGGAGVIPYFGHTLPYLYEEGIRVPLLARIPWRPELAGKISTNVSLLDVAPTILDAFGLPVPGSFEGRPLEVDRPPAAPALPVYSDAPKYDALAVRLGPHKMIARPDYPPVSWEDGRPLPPAPPRECFDLAADPAERHPLDCTQDWAAGLQLALQRYVAEAFPWSVLLRIPARAAGEKESRYILRARAPDLRVSAYGAAPEEEPRAEGGRAEGRLPTGRSPVWIAFQPWGNRSLQLEIESPSPVRSSAGKLLDNEMEASWTELLWRGESLLPEGPVVFSTPPGRAAAAGPEVQYTAELVARLRALGYLTAGTQAAEPAQDLAPPAGQGSEIPARDKPGTIRIRTIRK
jgi:hypothetical protein